MTSPLSANMQPRYDEDSPGLYCLSHRSVYCEHSQESIATRSDTVHLAEVVSRLITPGKLAGENFYIAVPIYPELCIWEVVSYQATFHDMLGPMGELVGKHKDRHKVIYRLLPGESAADLGFSLRQNFEDDEVVQANIELLRNTVPSPGRPIPLPRCAAASHSMKYQKLINEMFSAKNLRENWDYLRDQTYGAMWTYHYYNECVFCWTKRNNPDAIRVAPDFAVESAAEGDFSDLVPSPPPSRWDGGATHPDSPF